MDFATSERRTNAKRAVTVAAKLVQKGVDLNMGTMDEMVRTLDSKLIEFLDACEKFNELLPNCTPEQSVVNGLTPEAYEQETIKTYSQAMERYRSSHVSSNISLNSSSVESREKNLPSASLVKLKRQEAPKFSGARRDWPEFKNVWLNLVVPAINNEIALATELKAACKDGVGFNEIKNISAGASGAYNRMWDALCLHYDNVVLSVESALSDLKKLRPVKPEDYRATVVLISNIDNIYNQLDMINQVAMVTA